VASTSTPAAREDLQHIRVCNCGCAGTNRSGNEQALRLAIIEEARLRGEELSEDEIKRLLTDVPTEHLVGRVMAMTTTAERLLKAGDRVEGK